MSGLGKRQLESWPSENLNLSPIGVESKRLAACPGEQPVTASAAVAAAAQPAAQQCEPAERTQDGAVPAPDTQTASQLHPAIKRLPIRVASSSFYKVNKALSGGGVPRAGSSQPQPVQQRSQEERIQRFLLAVRERRDRWRQGEQKAPPVWETFPTQQPAFDRADIEPGLDVFSVEYNSEGKRRFITTTRTEFWRRYRDMLPEHRHHYEIIRQGQPCHLYFDLEFQTADNPGLDGAAATDALLALVGAELARRFQLDLQPSWVLELDSSTDAKFSRHLVVRIPGAAFASNAHAGAFVLELCAAAKERRGEDPQAAMLVVKKGEEEALFADPAVYSRNRAFRLYLSSKCGKQAVLECTGRYGGANLTMQEVFDACLITAVEPEARLLRCFKEGDAEEAAAAAAHARRAAGAGLHSLRGVPRGALGGGAAVSYGPCPYPELEAFINTVCCEGGAPGQVRSWVALDDLLLFNIRGNRFCGNVGRAHKSNGIFFVVDFSDASWHQRCYDPECRHYRSPLMPLPQHLLGLCRPWQQAPTIDSHGCQSQGGCRQPLRAIGGQSNVGCGCGFASSGSSSGAGPCWAGAELDEDSLMLQAMEQYEQAQQAQQPQAQPQQQMTTMPTALELVTPARDAEAAAPPPPHLPAQPAAGTAAAAAGTGAARAAAAGPRDDDDLLLEALLQFEQRSAHERAPTNAAAETLADRGAVSQTPTAQAVGAALPEDWQQAQQPAGQLIEHQAAPRQPCLSSLLAEAPVQQAPAQQHSGAQHLVASKQQQQPGQGLVQLAPPLQQARQLEIWEKLL